MCDSNITALLHVMEIAVRLCSYLDVRDIQHMGMTCCDLYLLVSHRAWWCALLGWHLEEVDHLPIMAMRIDHQLRREQLSSRDIDTCITADNYENLYFVEEGEITYTTLNLSYDGIISFSDDKEIRNLPGRYQKCERWLVEDYDDDSYDESHLLALHDDGRLINLHDNEVLAVNVTDFYTFEDYESPLLYLTRNGYVYLIDESLGKGCQALTDLLIRKIERYRCGNTVAMLAMDGRVYTYDACDVKCTPLRHVVNILPTRIGSEGEWDFYYWMINDGYGTYTIK